MRIALVGLGPGPNTHPDYPLWPSPRTSAGGRLLALTGLTAREYFRAFERHNLFDHCPAAAELTPANLRAQYARLRPRVFGAALLVLLGREVHVAFGMEGRPLLKWHPRLLSEVALLPHPSGRNRWFNDAGNARAARMFFRELASRAMLADTPPHFCEDRRAGKGGVTMAGKAKARRKPPSKPKAVRPGTKRAKVLALMQRTAGATLAEICRATKWDSKNAREGIRLVQSYSGYKVSLDKDGRYHVKAGAQRKAPARKRSAAPKAAEAAQAA